jgi:hypothetical protein
MLKKLLWVLTLTFLIANFSNTLWAQESAVSGNVAGAVLDSTGAVVAGAKVTLTGAAGTKSSQTTEQGQFTFSQLAPGTYSVKVERQGFKGADVQGVEVAINRTSSVRITLVPGSSGEVVNVSAEATTVDTTSTAVGSNLSDKFYSSVPIQRNVAGLFYTTPGVVSGGGTGAQNPSISGSTGLENMYVADGVNITDPAFGGLGVFTRNTGSVGTGINLSFIKEVQVKTGGFEPQYGQATGGVIQIVTKSGSTAYHGAIAGYAAPSSTSATPLFRDAFRLNNVGNILPTTNYDVSGELGGYVPGARDRLFFFGSYNPSWTFNHFQAVASPRDDLNFTTGAFKRYGNNQISTRTISNNYAAKLTFKLSDKHQLESSVFGDPAHTDNGPQFANLYLQALPVLAAETSNDSFVDKWDYGTRNWVVRYNGTLSPTWLANASFTWNNNRFEDTPLRKDAFGITDSTTPNLNMAMSGLGFTENHSSDDYGLTVDTSKVVNFAGTHTFNVGLNNQWLNYTNVKYRTGLDFNVPNLGAANNLAIYGCNDASDPNCPVGKQTNAQLRMRSNAACTLCPLYTAADGVTRHVYLQQNRGEFGQGTTLSTGRYIAGYANDSWTLNRYVTVNLGLRWEQYRMQGTVARHTFVDNWAPRLGFSVDPTGDRKTKIYGNFGRYNYEMPLDAAIRNLSSESDLTDLRYAPPADASGHVIVNPDNSLPITTAYLQDPSHLLNGLAGGTGGAAGVSVSSTGFAPGTRMQYQDEFVVGFERELPHGVVFSARYLDRRLKRIVEDTAAVSPEGFVAGVPQQYLIANVSKSTDIFHNLKPTTYTAGTAAPCAAGSPSVDPVQDNLGNVVSATQAVCFNPDPNALTATGAYGGDLGPDGVPDGFVNPVRNYQAVEFEINKAFSKGWMMRTNYRIAKLNGNYEGAFRNDNQQTDPSVSSLFDFTAGNFNMLGDQFAIGPLNTDRQQVVNGYFSYTFSRSKLTGLTLGTGIRVESGTPISVLADHPAYLNSGEIPIGGRGSLGRTPVTGTVDFHAEYGAKLTERTRLKLGSDIFNLANSKRITLVDQNRDLSVNFANSNPDFQRPLTWQRPFYARFSVKLEF